MKKLFAGIVKQGKDDLKPLWSHALKLGEETGELCEAVNHHLGMLPHKKMKEPLEGEVADVILCALTILTKAYPNLSTDGLNKKIQEQLDIKLKKWINKNPKDLIIIPKSNSVYRSIKE